MTHHRRRYLVCDSKGTPSVQARQPCGTIAGLSRRVWDQRRSNRQIDHWKRQCDLHQRLCLLTRLASTTSTSGLAKAVLELRQGNKVRYLRFVLAPCIRATVQRSVGSIIKRTVRRYYLDSCPWRSVRKSKRRKAVVHVQRRGSQSSVAQRYIRVAVTPAMAALPAFIAEAPVTGNG